jgi:hypothetical protein
MHMDSTGGAGGPFTPQPIARSADSLDVGRSLDDASHDGNRNTSSHTPAHVAVIQAENHELRAEAEQLRADRSKMADILNRLMEVLGSKSPDRLVHDVRNVLNERELYRALADTIAE